MTDTLLIAMVIALIAGLMRGFAGVGSGMLMAPFFLQLFGPVDTIGTIILLELVVTGQLMPSVYREINWRIIAPMSLIAVLFMPIGSWLLVTLDPRMIAYGVSVLIIVFSIVLMAGWKYRGPRPMILTAGVGAISGVLMALTSLGNPPVMLYLLSSSDKAATNRANFTGYFAVTLVALILMMFFSGLIEKSVVTTVAYLLPGFILSVWLGSRLFRKSSELLYRRIALGILLCAGIYGLLR